MIELSNIKILKSSLYSFIDDGYFAFTFKEDNPSHEYEFENNDIILYCEDRGEFLIEGLVHELTEMTIKKLLIEFIKVNRNYLYHYFDSGSLLFRIHHLATVLSLPYYGIQFEHKNEYEGMLK